MNEVLISDIFHLNWLALNYSRMKFLKIFSSSIINTSLFSSLFRLISKKNLIYVCSELSSMEIGLLI